MKIGLVLSKPPAYSETFFLNKIKGLRKQDLEVVLFTQNSPGNFSLCPVKTAPKIVRNPLLMAALFLYEYLKLIPYANRVRRFFILERKEKTPVFHILKKIYRNAHLLKAKTAWLHFGFATLALGRETIAHAIGSRMAVSLRGFDIAVYPVKNPGCYQTLWKYADTVHIISDDLLSLAKQHGLPDSLPVKKITPAIDTGFFKPDKNRINNTIPVFMTTGRLHWNKGYPFILEALAILKKQGISFSYKIAGTGDDYERLAFLVRQLQLEKEVVFLGKVSAEEIKKQLQTSDIYLQYSVQEGFGNAVLEAQAMGVFCIVSNAEGLSENILHNKTGKVVPKYRPDLLAETILEILNLPEKEKEASIKTAQNRIRNSFNLEKQNGEFLDFYSV